MVKALRTFGREHFYIAFDSTRAAAGPSGPDDGDAGGPSGGAAGPSGISRDEKKVDDRVAEECGGQRGGEEAAVLGEQVKTSDAFPILHGHKVVQQAHSRDAEEAGPSGSTAAGAEAADLQQAGHSSSPLTGTSLGSKRPREQLTLLGKRNS